MSHCGVVVVQELTEFMLQIGDGGEISPPHGLSHDDPEHRLNLVQPGTVFGQVHEPDVMSRIAQERTTRRS